MNRKSAERAVLLTILAKANEQLNVARNALENGFYSEVSSRGYYAAFHAITAVLASNGLSFSSHAQTIGAFNREFVKTNLFARGFSRKLQRLFENRQTADYDWSGTVDEATAREDLDDAELIVETCRDYLQRIT